MIYPIDTTIPAPTRDRVAGVNYAALPLDSMAVGDSFLIPPADFGGRSVHSIAKVIRQRANRHGFKVRTSVRHPEKHDGDGPGLRVWKLTP